MLIILRVTQNDFIQETYFTTIVQLLFIEDNEI